MSYSDDDIQFLGGAEFNPSQLTDKQQSASRRWWIGIVALAFIALSAATFYFWQKANSHTLAFDYPLSRTSTEIIRDLEKMPTDSLQGVTMKVDSLYGVSMRLYELHGLTPTLSRTAPSDSDSTVLSHMVGTFIGMKTMNTSILATLSIKERNMQMGIIRLAL